MKYTPPIKFIITLIVVVNVNTRSTKNCPLTSVSILIKIDAHIK